MTLAVEVRHEFEDFTLDVCFSAPSRGVTALFGHSGSGKTSVLRAVAGLMRVNQGSVQLNHSVWQDSTTFVEPHLRSIGYVFQEASLFPHLSVEKNLLYGWRRVRPELRRIEQSSVIELLGIDGFLKRPVSQLSGGERQRVAIGRALLTSPQLLLMDEPLSALDKPAKQRILPYLQRINEQLGIPCLYVSHDLDEVAWLADHLVVMQAGKTIAQGEARELLTRPDLAIGGRNEHCTVLDGTVSAYDETYRLRWIDVAGHRLAVPGDPAKEGVPARVQIHAKDVSLALSPAVDSSVLNVLPVVVADLHDLDAAQVLVRLRLSDGQSLLSVVTRYSAEQLALKPGATVYAQVKSIALKR